MASRITYFQNFDCEKPEEKIWIPSIICILTVAILSSGVCVLWQAIGPNSMLQVLHHHRPLLAKDFIRCEANVRTNTTLAERASTAPSQGRQGRAGDLEWNSGRKTPPAVFGQKAFFSGVKHMFKPR